MAQHRDGIDRLPGRFGVDVVCLTQPQRPEHGKQEHRRRHGQRVGHCRPKGVPDVDTQRRPRHPHPTGEHQLAGFGLRQILGWHEVEHVQRQDHQRQPGTGVAAEEPQCEQDGIAAHGQQPRHRQSRNRKRKHPLAGHHADQRSGIKGHQQRGNGDQREQKRGHGFVPHQPQNVVGDDGHHKGTRQVLEPVEKAEENTGQVRRSRYRPEKGWADCHGRDTYKKTAVFIGRTVSFENGR